MRPKRYANLAAEVHRLKARNILEIGTHMGRSAVEMIRAASEHRPAAAVRYYGFDLFGPAPEHERTARTVAPAMSEVYRTLQPTGAGIYLCAGDSRQTLPRQLPPLPIMDLIFIDGGHSAQTVASDFEHCRHLAGPATPIILDDYWSYPEGGCNALVDRLMGDPGYRVELLEPVDVFQRDWGELRTRFAKVTRFHG